MSLTPDHVAARLAARPPTEASRRFRRAAVAAVLSFDPRPRVLLIERATRAGDRWSGHVAFPGGLESAADEDLLATARRETLEEVGLDLAGSGQLLGRMGSIRAVARGRPLPMTITPFVFHLTGGWTPALNHEVASCFWLPLDDAAAGRLDGRHEYRLGPLPLTLPCWRHDGHVVWGLTFQMLRALLERIA